MARSSKFPFPVACVPYGEGHAELVGQADGVRAWWALAPEGKFVRVVFPLPAAGLGGCGPDVFEPDGYALQAAREANFILAGGVTVTETPTSMRRLHAPGSACGGEPLDEPNRLAHSYVGQLRWPSNRAESRVFGPGAAGSDVGGRYEWCLCATMALWHRVPIRYRLTWQGRAWEGTRLDAMTPEALDEALPGWGEPRRHVWVDKLWELWCQLPYYGDSPEPSGFVLSQLGGLGVRVEQVEEPV